MSLIEYVLFLFVFKDSALYQLRAFLTSYLLLNDELLQPEGLGQGIATKAMAELLNYGFKELNINRVIAHINRDNIASLRVAEKLKMNFQGLVEFKRVPEQGKLFALTKEEYLQFAE